jgi:hypothetical protein
MFFTLCIEFPEVPLRVFFMLFLWHSRHYMTAAKGGGFLGRNKGRLKEKLRNKFYLRSLVLLRELSSAERITKKQEIFDWNYDKAMQLLGCCRSSEEKVLVVPLLEYVVTPMA